MRHASHKTLIGTLREHIGAWRKANGWSRETVIQMIVEAHERIDGPASTGIVFDSPTRDAYQRMKNNADKVTRWLDDEGKDTNLLPANFVLSILAALPLDRRLACMSELSVMVDVGVHPLDEAADTPLDINHIFEVQLANTTALQAATIACQNPTPENLERADLEILKAEAKTTRMRRVIAGAKAKCKGLFGRLRRDKTAA